MLRARLGPYPAPNADTIAALRQVYGRMSEAGIGRRQGAAVQVAQLEDGSYMVGASGQEAKASHIRQAVPPPEGMRWAADAVPFRRDELVFSPDGHLYCGGAECAEPKVLLSRGDGVAVTSQATMWYGMDNRFPLSPDLLGGGSLMRPCYSCLQHAERLLHAPELLRH